MGSLMMIIIMMMMMMMMMMIMIMIMIMVMVMVMVMGRCNKFFFSGGRWAGCKAEETESCGS